MRALTLIREPAFGHAVACHQKGKLEEAVLAYESLLAGPLGSDPHLQFAIGSAFAQLGRFGLAVDFLQRSVDGQPNNHEAWSNLGLSYRTLGLVPKAIVCHERALGLPMTADAKAGVLANLSGCYVNEGNPAKAISYAEMGLALKDMPQLHNHRALGLLELGQYAEGFAGYEQRVRLPEYTPRDYGSIPRWDGKETARLAIHGEQGLGDEILFLTGLKRVLERTSGEIHVECAKRLVGLLRHSFRDTPRLKFHPDHVALMSAVTPTAWVQMGSLYHYLGGFDRWTYLDPSRKFKKPAGKRVGLSWRGGTLRTHEYYRNGPLDVWKPLVRELRKAPGVEPVSVQYGPADEMARELGIEHDAASIADLDSLTGYLQSCDLVVTVCNTTVHLCGASGVPCIVLVPSKPAWRYALTGDRSDWYDSVRYVRQIGDEDWARVMARVLDHELVAGVTA